MSSPNILFIMSDQLIAALTGAYGHSVVRTPGLDRLAEEGVRFDAAYTPFPLCAPGRACIATGRHASAIGAYDNGALLAADHPTFAHYLSNAGYDTVASGKLHYVGPDQLHGLHRRLTTDIYSSDFGIYPEWIRIKETQGRDCEEVMSQRRKYNTEYYIGEGVHIDRWHTALAYDEETHFRALGYLRARGAKPDDAPFFLCASYHHPHEPFWPPREYWEMYEGAEIDIPEFPDGLDAGCSTMDRWLNAYHGTHRFGLRDPESLYRLRRAYYGLVTYMDRKVGELLDALERAGLADSTVVVFTSDHGDMLGERAMVQKRCFYEWSCRVPLLVRFPDRWKGGTVCDTPVSLLDLLPTFCDLAETEAALPHDGSSLLPVIEGEEEDRIVFAQAHEAVGMPCLMARQGRYKYTYIHGYEAQLFDLKEDPGEWRDLSGQGKHAEVEQRLRKSLLDRFDADAIASDNLESLYRRRFIRDTMRSHGATWKYFPQFDARRGAMDQHLR